MRMYSQLSEAELEVEYQRVLAEYNGYKGKNLSLDMSRGKPGFDQMDLSYDLFHQISDKTGYKDALGTDCRNYGGLDGLPELKQLFGEILELPAEQTIVAGNSSLNLMFDFITQAMLTGLPDGKPWVLDEKRKFLCPCPGYDRHFSITEYYGFEMIPVPCDDNGPDMDLVEQLAAADPAVKGIWCVPKYSNPLGLVYSDTVVERLANMETAAPDFIIMWDNAYVLHALRGELASLANIYEACEKAGHPERVVEFTSTSKITFPGAGLAAMGASPRMIGYVKRRMSIQTIGPDKLNQLRHARMFHSKADVQAHMERHARILAPKFEAVLDAFRNHLEGLGIASWTNPQGGYFISLDVLDGCAKRTAALCAKAGLKLTGAGATFPLGKDPRDRNLRIAPSYPSVEELKLAAELLCVAVQLAALEKLTEKIV